MEMQKLSKVTCSKCGNKFEDDIEICPKCYSKGIVKSIQGPVIVGEETSLTDELMDAFDPTKGMNLTLIDPENVDKDMMIIMMGKNDNKFGICTERFRVTGREGEKLILEPYDEKGPEEARREIAKFIVQLNEEEIKESAVGMVEKALMRKPIKKLEELKKETKKEKKKGLGAKLKTKTGCVYLVIGDQEVLL